jgi:HEAT repeat protein
LATNAEQQNLINDLKAPIKSFRIFALEEAIKSGDSQEILDVLKQLKIEEDDGECQVLIGYAISAVEGRLSGATKKPKKKIKEQQEFFTQWEKSNDGEKMQILSQLPARLPAAIKPLGPELLSHEESTVISAKIIRVFCRTWPDEKFSMITDLLISNSLSLRLASLRTAVHLKPQTIVDDLPELLASEDPQIKALAIRGLAKIDKEEALKHLQALLLSSNLSDRLAGIQNCPFLPFDMVKPVLLKYFAAENHPELLIRAGWIIEMNPDMKVPFKLYEIAERSPAKKAEQVKKILNETVKLLEKSGILGDQFPVYKKKLQAWVNKRNALRFVKKIIPRLELETIPSDIDQLIRNRINQELIYNAFKEAMDWPVSDTVRGRLAAYLKSADDSTKEKLPQKKEKAETEIKSDTEAQDSSLPKASVEAKQPMSGRRQLSLKGSKEEIVSTLTALTRKEAVGLMTDIINLLNDRNSDNAVRAAVLDSLARLKLRGCEDFAEKLVTGNNIPVATAALEYLGAVEPERVFPYLGQCLKVPDIRMKSAALGILKNFDFNQAVSSLNAMLKSNDPAQQKMAIECMDQFDFSLIREDLTRYLEKCDHEELLEAGLCHYAANAAVENIYALYRIEQSQADLNFANHVKKVRKNCVATLKKSEIEIDESVAKNFSEEFLEQKWQNDQQEKKKARPAYAYKEEAPENKPDSKEQLIAIFELLKGFFASKALYIVLIILVLLAVGFYTLFMPGEAVDTKAGMGKAIVASKYAREGKVNKIVGTAVVFESVQGEEFIFHPVNDGYRMPERGSKLRVSLVPYRKTPDGGYLARVRALRKIKKFSAAETD